MSRSTYAFLWHKTRSQRKSSTNDSSAEFVAFVRRTFAKENVAVLEMKRIKATLEDIFIDLTGKGAE